MAEFEDDSIEQRFDDLCNELNIDEIIQEEAWDKYKEVWNNYSLDGDHLQWLVCALYVSFRKKQENMLNQTDLTEEYCMVSLKNLIKQANMNYVQFFSRIKIWCDMVDISEYLKDRIYLLERQFSVAAVLFKKFLSIYYKLFDKEKVLTENSGSNNLVCDEYLSSQLTISTEDCIVDSPSSKRRKIVSSFKDKDSNFNVNDLFKFSWILFSKFRSRFPGLIDDFVGSYNLMVCLLDVIFTNAVQAQRRDIINPTFYDLLTGDSSKNDPEGISDFALNSLPQDRVLRVMCDLLESNFIECKVISDFYVKPYFQMLLEKEFLKGRHLTMTGILENANFDISFRLINNLYGDFVRYTGDFDERIFLSSQSREDIGCARDHLRAPYAEAAVAMTSIHVAPEAIQFMELSPNKSKTELTKPTNEEKSAIPSVRTPVGLTNLFSQAKRVECLNQLQILMSKDVNIRGTIRNLIDSTEANTDISIDSIGDITPEDIIYASSQVPISECLQSLINSHCCGSMGESPLEFMKNHIETLCGLFIRAYCKGEKQHLQSAQQRLIIILHIYYFTVNAIVMDEINRAETIDIEANQGGSSLVLGSNVHELKQHFFHILNKSTFHTSVFAISSEIVLSTCDSQKHFPWILHALDFQSYHFFKIIAVTVRCLPDLPRDLVRYFNGITEFIVDEMAWEAKSALWDNIQRDATRKQQLLLAQGNYDSVHVSGVPPIIEVMPSDMFEVPKSTKGTTITESDMTGKQIKFNVGDSISQNRSLGENSLKMETIQPSVSGGLSIQILRPTGSAFDGHAFESGVVPKGNIKIRHDLLGLFFRNFYYVASCRLRDICSRLSISKDIVVRIWTCFEWVIREQTFLIYRRCLDQLLLCCIFAVHKLSSNRQLTFTDIIHAYRIQPQSHTCIYRKVYLEQKEEEGDESLECSYGDLVQYYNWIFLPNVREYVIAIGNNISSLIAPPLQPIVDKPLKVGNKLVMSGIGNATVSASATAPNLSPMPVKTLEQANSIFGKKDRRITTQSNIFLSPFKKKPQQSPKRITFTVGQSPNKYLREINGMIAQHEKKCILSNSLNYDFKRINQAPLAASAYSSSYSKRL